MDINISQILAEAFQSIVEELIAMVISILPIALPIIGIVLMIGLVLRAFTSWLETYGHEAEEYNYLGMQHDLRLEYELASMDYGDEHEEYSYPVNIRNDFGYQSMDDNDEHEEYYYPVSERESIPSHFDCSMCHFWGSEPGNYYNQYCLIGGCLD
jgi:hypothetical protein